MIHKIVFTGPESTGKTTLTERLSALMHITPVREVARDFIGQLHRPYEYQDLLSIAMLQMSEEERIKSSSPKLLICDTDLLTIKIWAEDKFHQCEHWLTHAFVDRAPDIYFLCVPDFPWQPDPLREDPDRREHLFHLYRNHLIHYQKRFIELTGSVEQRVARVQEYLHGQDARMY